MYEPHTCPPAHALLLQAREYMERTEGLRELLEQRDQASCCLG